MTEEQATLATRKHFADGHSKCIEGAKIGEFHVNDLDSYIEWQQKMINEGFNGDYDHTFAHLQYKHYLLTGISVPLLP